MKPSFVLIALVACPAMLLAQDTRVPRWDARGVGPLPPFGITSLDVRPTGEIVVGTIAAPGDPNVLVFDAAGKLVGAAKAGQRWIDQAVFGPKAEGAYAVSTMPEGKSGDNPQIFHIQDNEAFPQQTDHEGTVLFHYGDHSNHPTVRLARSGEAVASVSGRTLTWSVAGAAPVRLPFANEESALSFAVDDKYGAVVGGVVADPKRANLIVLAAPVSLGSTTTLFQRPALTDVDAAPPAEKGLYGTPTLPDGRREELPQRDEKVWAALAVAIHRAESGKRLIASADYQGWQRWVRSSATLKDSNQGLRFMPSRPTITVYTEKGDVVRQFAAEKFAKALWCDLAFTADGRSLIAWPHSWRCRGLAGQPMLPADEPADTFYVLDIAGGGVRHVKCPDAIADLAVSNDGRLAISCWDGKIYQMRVTSESLPKDGIGIGGPALVRYAGDSLVFAETRGRINISGRDQVIRQIDLEKVVPKSLKPWVANARATPIVKGLWQIPGGRVESDLGGQRLIEGPDGYVLIEGHAGLSFEREWESMKAVGLDPNKAKYVLATHEHGDHAPGAYLWRVVAGAKFVCSDEMAYTLQHHIPLNTGYGLHPPVPTDIRISKDTELDLAGVKVRAVKIPGHTFGSMAWHFEKDGKTFVAFGDLIMPRGVLGYSGSVNFSATDALASLRKLQALKPDLVLPGHGAIEGPEKYLGDGIDVGASVGWGFIRPERPDPRFRLTQKNVDVVGWGAGATSAALGDLDGDGRPDVAIVSPKGEGSVVRIFLNRKGKFADSPAHEIDVPQVGQPHKIRIEKTPKGPLVFVAGKTAAMLEADGAWPRARISTVDLGDGNHLRAFGDELLTCRRFGNFQRLAPDKDRLQLRTFAPEVAGPYVDFRIVPLKDSREALVSAYGNVHIRDKGGSFPAQATLNLGSGGKDWSFLGVGDFNGDGRADLALLSYGMNQSTQGRIFYQRPEGRPFGEQPDLVLPLFPQKDPKTKNTPPLVRDNPAVADWNGDGIDDLIVAHGQHDEVFVFLGGKAGLDPARMETIKLDYRVHFEHGPFVADFDGDGRPDLAVFGYTNTGVGAGGPPAAYIYRQVK